MCLSVVSFCNKSDVTQSFVSKSLLVKIKRLLSLQRKSEGSYQEAKRLLKRQFGDPLKIANAYIMKLFSWQPIRPNDGQALEHFSIALDQSKSAMKGMSHMNDLSTAYVLRQL